MHAEAFIWTLLMSWSLLIFRTCLNNTYWQNWLCKFLKSGNYWAHTHSLSREKEHIWKFRQGYSSYFWGFETWLNPIIRRWQIFELSLGVSQILFHFIFWVWKILSYFCGYSYFSIMQLNHLNGEHTVLKNKIQARSQELLRAGEASAN